MLRRLEPIFLRRSFGTPSSLPQFIREGCDVGVSECGDSVSNRRLGRLPMRFGGMLLFLARVFVSGEMFLFSVLFGNAMGVRGQIAQFGGFRMVLVMRSFVVASRHRI